MATTTENTKPKKPHADIRHPLTDLRSRLTCESHKDAEKVRSAAKARRDALIDVVGETTFLEAGQDLVAELREQNRPGVADTVERHLRDYLAPLCGDKRLRLQTPQTMGTIAQDLRVAYLGKSSAYYKAGLNVLCRILRHGFKHLAPPVRYKSDIPGLYLERAVYGSTAPEYKAKPIPRGSEVSLRLAESVGGMRILLHILILLGLRIGEALALRRGDIELYRGKYWLHVRHSQRVNGELKDPKSTAGKRRIPLNSRMRKLLLNWLAKTEGLRDDQLVSGMPGVRLTYKTVARHHIAFQERLGGPVFNFHRYRAACVTTWLISGVRLSNVMKWIGHADLRMTVQIYATSILVAEAVWQMLNPEAGKARSPQSLVQAAVDASEPAANENYEHEEMEAVA